MKMTLVAVAVATCVAVAAPASAQHQPVNEGGDYRHCVTYAEFMAVYVQTPLHKAQRIFDTKGELTAMRHIDGVAAAVGISSSRQPNPVQRFPVCAEPTLGIEGGTVLVQYKLTSPRHRILVMDYQDG